MLTMTPETNDYILVVIQMTVYIIELIINIGGVPGQCMQYASVLISKVFPLAFHLIKENLSK